ncbi:hypothetical protein TNCV_4131501 [Trichonephila clavipes]|nr:hypothetical protein TNCV_4131501 [Trichonephila clavipes]
MGETKNFQCSFHPPLRLVSGQESQRGGKETFQSGRSPASNGELEALMSKSKGDFHIKPGLSGYVSANLKNHSVGSHLNVHWPSEKPLL